MLRWLGVCEVLLETKQRFLKLKKANLTFQCLDFKGCMLFRATKDISMLSQVVFSLLLWCLGCYKSVKTPLTWFYAPVELIASASTSLEKK